MIIINIISTRTRARVHETYSAAAVAGVEACGDHSAVRRADQPGTFIITHMFIKMGCRSSVAILLYSSSSSSSSIHHRQHAPAEVEPVEVPPTIQLDGAALVHQRAAFRRGDHTVVRAVANLKGIADSQLITGPFTVTNKSAPQILPPTGDVHDYLSTSSYWWPCTSQCTAAILKSIRVASCKDWCADWNNYCNWTAVRAARAAVCHVGMYHDLARRTRPHAQIPPPHLPDGTPARPPAAEQDTSLTATLHRARKRRQASDPGTPALYPCNATTGAPWVSHSGYGNPAGDKLNRKQADGVWHAVYPLTLYWWYTAEPKYLARAALILRVYFLDPVRSNAAFSRRLPGQECPGLTFALPTLQRTDVQVAKLQYEQETGCIRSADCRHLQ